jgi:hypothetical protein
MFVKGIGIGATRPCPVTESEPARERLATSTLTSLSFVGFRRCKGNRRVRIALERVSRDSEEGGSSFHRQEEMMAKYGKKAQAKVRKVMHERKTGTLRSGGSGKKVTSRKQAIAIGLSEARQEGDKVPPKKTAKKSAKKAPAKKPAKKSAKKASAGKSAKKKPARKASTKKSAPKKRATKKSAKKNAK